MLSDLRENGFDDLPSGPKREEWIAKYALADLALSPRYYGRWPSPPRVLARSIHRLTFREIEAET